MKLNRILAELARDGKLSHDMGVAVQGNEALRIQVAQRAFSYGCELAPAELVVTAGCTEAMNLCLQAVCQPGDLVAIESPPTSASCWRWRRSTCAPWRSLPTRARA